MFLLYCGNADFQYTIRQEILHISIQEWKTGCSYAIRETCILLFKKQGTAGERFADTVTRLGFENVQKKLLSRDLLSRKEDIKQNT